ncbi:chemotaxis protein [Vibrio sp. 10N.286.49.C2]|uniref:methyl-accepting chemotaxis protein n=1 Tax=unclassified Vibrio TaxID=2614977 RepID=UPI000C81DF13|nr:MULTISPECIES: methyl-accepting chemotaxis protein [unclassified Vibrio]PMH26485.1 chemotaxis protein [Vibrio sp. 10N.286.49.C2]PMH54791.1 chemotaxis protein [Vibrio sp. 10N.286.49.B1]PMH83967.1 chemotaxis protein [Vibrio sp. 10N.286.48.B7]
MNTTRALKKTLGFKTKLILALTLTTTLSLVVTSLFSHNMLQGQVNQRIQTEIDSSLSHEVIELETTVQRTIDTVSALATQYQNNNGAIANETLMLLASELGGIDKVVMGFDDGSSFTSKPSESFPNGVGIKSKYDPTTRPWYNDAKQVRGLSLSDVFFTKSDQTPMIGVMYSLSNSVIMADIRFNDVQRKLEELNYISEATAFIIDDKGLVIASTMPDITQQTRVQDSPLSAEIAAVIRQPAVFSDTNIAGIDSLLISKPIQLGNQTTWQMVVALNKSIALTDLASASQKSTLIIVAAVLIALVAVILILNKLYQPIVSLKAIVHDLAKGNGDLTQRLEVKTNDDLGHIALSINQFIDGLQAMLQDVQSATTALATKTQSIEASCQHTHSTLETHTLETTQIVTAIDELSNASVVVEQHSSAAANAAHKASDYSDETKQINSTTQQHIIDLELQITNTSSDIADMANETQSIQSIVNMIGSIAEQTNLLALNASIEAARAGEHGRGFAVVADEVRALANRTQISTSEIGKALATLQDKSDSLVTSIEHTKENCAETRQQVDHAVAMLGTLDQQIETISSYNAEISTSSSEQNTVIQSVNENIHKINDLVNALNTLSHSQVEESANILVLNQQVETLISRFKV